MARFLVTGSSGHLGEALVRSLAAQGHDVVGLDLLASPFTTMTGSITDTAVVAAALEGVTHVPHTAMLHKPHIGSHTRQDFVDTNITGTSTLLEQAAEAGVRALVFTSSTSAFGRALTPAPDQPAAWITEDVVPVARNIYVKVNEFCYHRVDLADVVDAHLLAADQAPDLGFGRYVISATTPFTPDDAAELALDAPAVLARRLPDLAACYQRQGWRMFPTLDRIYVNDRARHDLGWTPRYDIQTAAQRAANDADPRSPLARLVGAKGYHPVPTGIYTR